MTEHPMKPICVEWLAKIELAKQAKEERFGKYAREAMKFFDGAHDWMWDKKYSNSPGGFLEKGAQLPTFRMTVNRVFEIVALFGPALYHQNPHLTVTPLNKPNPGPASLGFDMNNPYHAEAFDMVQMQREMQKQVRLDQSGLFEAYLNWLTVEGDLKTQFRYAITEALVKGLSLMWIEPYQPKGSDIIYPRSRNVSVDDIVVDPDATCWDDVQWVARRCEHAVNLVESKYGLRPGTIKGHKQSMASQATERGKKEAQNNRRGTSFDLCEYWQVYSKNGFGQLLANKENRKLDSNFDFSIFGDNCLIVVAKDVPYPLNIPPESFAEGEEAVVERGQWPVPFWIDEASEGGWPFARLYFYDKPNSVWPISLIKPAIGEMRFVNWCMSFLADKVASSCTTYLGVLKSAANEIQKQLSAAALSNGQSPFTILELSEITGTKIQDLVTFLQAPDFNESIWRMVAEVNASIDKRLSLIDLRYGYTQQQMRSAAEADVKEQGLNIVPDDMASKTEDSLTKSAIKQVVAAYWVCSGKDMVGVLGPDGARVWDEQIKTLPLDEILRDFQFRIEAGSARKPNKSAKVRTLQEFGQVLPVIVTMAMETGQFDIANAYIADWCKSNDLDPTPYLLQPPDPASQPPSPEEMQIQAKAAEVELKQEEMGAKLQFQTAEHKQEMRQDQEKHKLEMAQLKQKAKVDNTIGKQKLALQKQQAKVKKAASQGARK